MPVQFWTFHFVKQLPPPYPPPHAGEGREGAHAKSPQWPAPRGPTRSYRLDVLGHLPLSRLVRRRGWPCAGYYGLVNPSSGVFVCWNRISAHECRQSLGRLLGRAAVMVTRYGRIERIVPHRAVIFIAVGASKIKAIMSSFDDCRKMKRLLRETDDRGYKIVPSAAGSYFLRYARRPLHKCLLGFDRSYRERSSARSSCRVGWLVAIFGVGLGCLKMRFDERW